MEFFSNQFVNKFNLKLFDLNKFFIRKWGRIHLCHCLRWITIGDILNETYLPCIHIRCPVWNSVVGCLCTNTKYMYFEISSENGLMELWCHANCVSTQIKWNQSAYMIQLIVRLILWDTPLLQPPRYAKPFLFQFPYLSIALVSTKRVCELAMLPSTSSSS